MFTNIIISLSYLLRQLDSDLSIHAGHQLNDKYLATLGFSKIRTVVYQGLLIFFFFDFSLVDTGQETDSIYNLFGFAESWVFGKQVES